MKKRISLFMAILTILLMLPINLPAYATDINLIQEPQQPKNYVYTGEEIVAIPDHEGYTAKGNKGKEVGVYTAEITLKENYRWISGKTDSKRFQWEITPGELSVKSATIKNKYYDGTIKAEATVVLVDSQQKEFKGKVNVIAEFENAEVGNNKKVTVKVSVDDKNYIFKQENIQTTANILKKTEQQNNTQNTTQNNQQNNSNQQNTTQNTTQNNEVKKTKPEGKPSYTPITEEWKTLADAKLTKGSINVDGTIKWKKPDTTYVEANVGYEWNFTPKDTEKYESVSGNIIVYEDNRTVQQKLKDAVKDQTTASLTGNITDKKDDTRLEIRGTFSEERITDDLKKAGFNTVYVIEERLKTAIKNTNTGFSGNYYNLYDVSMIYTNDYGTTWKTAGKNQFPADGYLKVSIPVPGQLDPEFYNFTVAHMFSTDDYGKNPGDIEFPTVTERTDSYGIHYLDFYITGLSPVMIAWEADSDMQNTLHSTEDLSEDGNMADPMENQAAADETEEIQPTASPKKLAILSGIGILFVVLVLWIAKKIAWG